MNIQNLIEDIKNLYREIDRKRVNIAIIIKSSKDIGRKGKMILTRRYVKARTFEEIAREFGVTRERIRQLEAKYLEILRQENKIK